MAKKPDDRRMRAWQSLLLSHHALFQRLDRELEEAVGLPLQWYEVLLRIYRAPGRRMRMQELVDSMLFTPSGLTRLVDRLVENGLVRREKCPSDRRGTYAALTEHGMEVFRQAGPVHLKGIQQHFGCHLTDDEADAVAEGLGRIVETLTPDRHLV